MVPFESDYLHNEGVLQLVWQWLTYLVIREPFCTQKQDQV
jgi:hypothetical protein